MGEEKRKTAIDMTLLVFFKRKILTKNLETAKKKETAWRRTVIDAFDAHSEQGKALGGGGAAWYASSITPLYSKTEDIEKIAGLNEYIASIA